MNRGKADEIDLPLSPAGQARRRGILDQALHQAERRRRRRAALRLSFMAAAAVVAASVGVAVFFATRVHPPIAPTDNGRVATTLPSPAPTRAAPTSSPAPSQPEPPVVVQVVRSRDVRTAFETIDDEQLLAALADAGRPSGIVRLNGRAEVVPLQ